MLNEIEEFNAYTGTMDYFTNGKYDSTYLGRFTYDMLLKFDGLARVFIVIARGYMYKDGAEPQIDTARRALCAWCSVPDSKKCQQSLRGEPKADWQYKTNFKDLHYEFPELVDDNGCGWFYRHVNNVIAFVQNHPNKVLKAAQSNCEKLQKGFDSEWRKKVLQFQIPLFAPTTKGAWILRFDDILADALESGTLREQEVSFTPDEMQRIESVTPEGVPTEVIVTLIAYYRANKPEDSDWVVLPVTNFDAYLGNTSFSRKWLSRIPLEIIDRQKQSFGVCRYRITDRLFTYLSSPI